MAHCAAVILQEKGLKIRTFHPSSLLRAVQPTGVLSAVGLAVLNPIRAGQAVRMPRRALQGKLLESYWLWLSAWMGRAFSWLFALFSREFCCCKRSKCELHFKGEKFQIHAGNLRKRQVREGDSWRWSVRQNDPKWSTKASRLLLKNATILFLRVIFGSIFMASDF